MDTIPLLELKKALQKAWDRETCYPKLRGKWDTALPETGQCAVTALVVQENLGGKIAFNKNRDHFWNILPEGKHIDLTRRQFKDKAKMEVDSYVPRNELLHSKSAEQQKTLLRYRILKKRVTKNLTNTLSVAMSNP